MNYLQDRRTKKKKKGLWVAGAILAIILILWSGSIFGGLSFVAGESFRPILSAGNAMGNKLRSLGAYFVSKRSLSVENKILIEKMADLEAGMSNYNSLRDENIILKEILGRTEASDHLVVAAILSKPNQSAYDTLLIDAGSDEGLHVGDLVLARGHIPIGKIVAVTPNSAKVVLFSSSGERTSARLATVLANQGEEKNVLYDLVGRGGGNFEMVLPRDVAFGPGDTALLPGINSRVLARAESVISDPRDPFKKILLSSPANFQHLAFVQIQIK